MNEMFVKGDTVLNLNLPDKPKLSLSQVRAIFINSIKSDGMNYNNTSIQDSCINMEFGYYDLYSGSGNHNQEYTTAWKVNPDKRDYPYAYIDDLNERLIYYDNGVRTKK
jgi:hypothetical protein